jgi:hypothetical protein
MDLPKRSNGWTAERRAKQAAAIRNWRPWEQSTGPRTEAGKQKSAQNSLKHGWRSKAASRLRALLRQQRAFVKSFDINFPSGAGKIPSPPPPNPVETHPSRLARRRRI